MPTGPPKKWRRVAPVEGFLLLLLLLLPPTPKNDSAPPIFLLPASSSCCSSSPAADDSGGGEVYVYIGTKTNTGNAVQKAGLANGQVYGIKVNAGVTGYTGAVTLENASGINGTFALAPIFTNATIAAKLAKAGVDEVEGAEFTRTNDGFNGLFVVNTPTGPKSVHIETITAGGYNIQCLHLRVLVTVR